MTPKKLVASFHHPLWEACLLKDVYAALAAGQEEQIARLVPFNFVYFKVKLLFCVDFEHSSINECDQIFLVTHSNGISIWRPCNIYVFTYK